MGLGANFQPSDNYPRQLPAAEQASYLQNNHVSESPDMLPKTQLASLHTLEPYDDLRAISAIMDGPNVSP